MLRFALLGAILAPGSVVQDASLRAGHLALEASRAVAWMEAADISKLERGNSVELEALLQHSDPPGKPQ